MAVISRADKRQVVLEHSPVSFVLIGPKGSYRGTLVRSAGQNLDLIGMDHDLAADGQSEGVTADWLTSLIYQPSNLNSRHIVKSERPIYTEDDGRSSFYTFAWRGLARQSDVLAIQKKLSRSLPDVAEAIRSGEISRVEWQLASLVFMCQSAHERLKTRATIRRWVYLSTTAFYATLIAAYLFWTKH